MPFNKESARLAVRPERKMKMMRSRLVCLILFLLPTAAGLGDPVDLLKSSGVKGGLVVHIGCGDGGETVGLLLNERYIVQGLDVSDGTVQKARQNIGAAGCYGKVSARKFDGRNLPYVDNFVNVVIVDGDFAVSEKEIMRVLAPLGVGFVNGRKIVKPWPDNMDEWNHFLHGPDNNAVAKDSVIGIPRSIQWVSPPRWGRSHEELAGMSAAVSAKGRVFFIFDKAPLASIRYSGQWELVGRDAFNGTLLWTRSIEKWNDHLRHFRSGPVHLPRRLVAVDEAVYATLGIDAPVSAIDAATGRTIRVYEGTERTEEILVRDGVLYLVVGTSEIYRRGGGLFERGEPKPTDYRYVTAVEAKTGRTLWKRACAENEFLLPLSLTVNRSGVFYQSTGGIVRLDCKSGDEVWKTPRPTPRMRMSFSSPTIVATDEVLLCADRAVSKDNTADGKVEWGVHGWNVAGFPRRGKSILKAYSVKDGKELWSVACSEDYNSAVDVFVVGETVWVGANYTGYDLKTGELVRQLDWKGPPVAMAHHRCYRNKATEKFIFTGRAGIEVVSLDEGWLSNNSWIRGTCQYGIMPANGLLYAPPDACACFPKVKLAGFFAAAPQRGESGRMPFPGKPVLEKGPAWGKEAAANTADSQDWPTYRHDASRSGAAATAVPSTVRKLWSADVGSGLTQPVIAGGKVFVASTETHTVAAFGADTGEALWSYTAGARVDSSPTLYKGMVLFGCRDGWVYALSADNGRLVWRFRAAPQERQVCVLDQLESVWPVHGAVLMQNDTLYVAAGRSTYLDGGIVLYRLDPMTAKVLSRTVVCDLDPETGQQTGVELSRGFDMEGSLSDILSGDGDSVFMKHLNFDKAGNKIDEQKPHLFCITGFLGEEWFVRSYWLIGTDVGAGWGGWARSSQIVPTGRILCFDEDRIFGYGRKKIASGAVGHRLDSYRLFAKTKIMTQTKTVPKAPKKRNAAGSSAAVKPEPGTWSKDISLVVRAMVLTSDKLVIAGVPDVARKEAQLLAYENEAETLAAFKGEKGAFLEVVSSSDGKVLGQCKLDAMCVFDGLSAASGRIFVSLKDGTLQCWGQ